MTLTIMVRGGGDLSSGVVFRLVRSGWQVFVTELPHPLAVRRLVSFSQAIFSGRVNIEGIEGVRVETADEARRWMAQGKVPVFADPEGLIRKTLQPQVIVDGRMTKCEAEICRQDAQLVIGLGPGFIAGENCHAVVETKRGPYLGRVYWRGSAEPDSGEPDQVGGRQEERVLRAPATGEVYNYVEIGARVEEGQPISKVNGQVVTAPFRGLLRGLIYPGTFIQEGVKIGDIDPRLDPRLCASISDKALAMGGSVLEAILSTTELRPHLWD